MAGTLTPTKIPKLWNPKFVAAELGWQVTTIDTSKEHDTCMALEQDVMLSQDVANLAIKSPVEFINLMVMQHV